jgi:hypothetical protein
MMFADAAFALDFWRTQSPSYPVRSDGRPNRPLTSTTFEIIKITPVQP